MTASAPPHCSPVRPRVDLAKYRQTESEQRRVADILQLVPGGSEVALDVGARDGYLSQLLADRVKSLTALDLETPSVSHPHVACVKGDVTQLSFPDASFDLVVCTEVLEHIRPELLRQACSELMRVASRHLLVGVPYRQDIRVGRTTCGICGGVNPPWGHVNAFDEELLRTLFAGWTVEKTSFVGHNDSSTNRVATLLMDLARNPYGTYGQEEPCIHCGSQLGDPPARTMAHKVLSKVAFWTANATAPFHRPHAYWIHQLLTKV